ncbi:NAD-P-binding protein [Peniophora sp. CONT]|nr:NAD-P-binding protein [Peniophora sp. CONT]
MAQSAKKVMVLAGVGSATGVGSAAARLFARSGYNVALISRASKKLDDFAESVRGEGGQAAVFPLASYSHADMQSAFTAARSHWPDTPIRVAIFNAGVPIFKPFLDTSAEDFQSTVDTNVMTASSFARESILTFKGQELDEHGKRGTLLFTGASAALRGSPVTAAFSMGKHAVRALAQSLGKEFGKENIHVAHAVVDGLILQEHTRSLKGEDWASNPDARLDPQNIAKAYMYLVEQGRSAWTSELDLRPAHENW